MNSEQILESFNEIFRDVLDIEDLVVNREMTAADVEEWDSLAHINLIVAIEKEFNVKFTLEELTDVKNVGETVDLVARKLS